MHQQQKEEYRNTEFITIMDSDVRKSLAFNHWNPFSSTYIFRF